MSKGRFFGILFGFMTKPTPPPSASKGMHPEDKAILNALEKRRVLEKDPAVSKKISNLEEAHRYVINLLFSQPTNQKKKEYIEAEKTKHDDLLAALREVRAGVTDIKDDAKREETTKELDVALLRAEGLEGMINHEVEEEKKKEEEAEKAKHAPKKEEVKKKEHLTQKQIWREGKGSAWDMRTWTARLFNATGVSTYKSTAVTSAVIGTFLIPPVGTVLGGLGVPLLRKMIAGLSSGEKKDDHGSSGGGHH